MSEMSKKARAEMRAKANRLAGRTDPHKRVDASSWVPNEPLNAGRKTGARPIRSRIYKVGGAVQHDRGPVKGDRAPRNPGKACRGGAFADGGKVGTGPLSMADVAGENERQFGKYHVGGYKEGGAAKDVHKHERHMHKGEPLTKLKSGGNAEHWIAGAIKHPGALHKTLDVPEGKKIPAKKLEKAEHSDNPKTAKRAHLAETLRGMHARGGRAKGKTNINIVIAQPRGQQVPQMPPQGPVRPPMPPPQMPPPAATGGPPPGGMPVGAPPPGPGGPMMRASGGRTRGDAIPIKHASAAGGLGRLEKVAIQKRSNRARGGVST